MKAVKVAVGWCEDVQSRLDQAKASAMTFGGLLDATCIYCRGDVTTPPIALEDFAPNGPIMSAKIVYLVGHGGGAAVGFQLPSRTAVKPAVVAPISGDLRWLVLDSCAAFERGEFSKPEGWLPLLGTAFQILGHVTFATCTAERARIFATYLNQGFSVLDSWRWAVEEVDGKAVWGVLSAEDRLSEKIDSTLPSSDGPKVFRSKTT